MEWLKDAAGIWGAMAILCATVAGVWIKTRPEKPSETGSLMTKITESMHAQALGAQQMINILAQIFEANKETHKMLRVILDRQWNLHNKLNGSE